MVEDAPHDCPGTQSEEAGRASACAGCPNQQLCASAPKGPDPAVAVIANRLRFIEHKILVLSGKGGVGKSTFATQLAWALSASNDQVGLLDIDVCGPSVPMMTHTEGEEVRATSQGWTPVYAEDNLGVISVGFMLGGSDEAVIWRGPKKNDIIKQFLKDVHWGEELKYMIVDCPPGTSDEHLSVTQYINAGQHDGVIIVTTPQEVALLDVRKEINFCRKVKLPVLGVVENMSGFACPKCHVPTQLFAPTTGGAEAMAAAMGVPFLGRLPLDPLLLQACEAGTPYLPHPRDGEDEWKSAMMSLSPAQQAFHSVVQNVQNSLAATKSRDAMQVDE